MLPYTLKKKIDHNSLVTFNLYEQIVITELINSYWLFHFNKKIFDVYSSVDEIIRLNNNLMTVIVSNNLFFKLLLSDINEIVNGTEFRAGFVVIKNRTLNSIFYFLNIVRAMLNLTAGIDNINYMPTYTHRNVVISNIKSFTKFFKFFENFLCKKHPFYKNILDVWKKILKCVMLMIPDSTKNYNKIMFYKIISKNEKRKKSNLFSKIISDVYLKFNVSVLISLNYRLNIVYSKVLFTQLDYYHIGASYLTLTKNYTRCIYQNTFNKFDTSIITKMSNIPIFIDFSKWKTIKIKLFSELQQEFKFSIGSFNDNVSISEIIDNLNVLVKDMKDAIKPKDTTLFIDSEENFNYKISNYKKIIQYLYNYLIIENSINIEFPIYISYKQDFRGRYYSNSLLSFVNLKQVRGLFSTNAILNEEKIKNSIYYNKIISISFDFKQFGIFIESDVIKYFFIIIFTELGKIYKNKNIINCYITLQEFINFGIINFENENVSFDDYAYYIKLKEWVDCYCKFKQIKNTLIMRDSTASFLQHWATLLNIKPDYATILNLNGKRWCDTYIEIINIFKNWNKNLYMNDPEIQIILERKILKRTIMVNNYNCGKSTTHDYLIDDLIQNNCYKNGYDYTIFVNDFHDFLNKELFNLMFYKNKDILLNELNFKTTIGPETISFMYNNLVEYKEELKIDKIRWFISSNKVSDDQCLWSTKISFPANLIQSKDAELASFLASILNIFFVHDNFCISIYDIHDLMDYTNLYFNDKLKNNWYSIFILK